MRILIVEDQPLLALALAYELDEAGHEVVGQAASSAEALHFATHEHIELAFVDIDLDTQGAGLHVAGHLHNEHHIAVIFTTGQPNLARACNYALGLFTKPYDPADIVAVVPACASMFAGETPASDSFPASFELFSVAAPTENLSQPKARSRPILVVEDHPKDLELTLAALAKCNVSNPIAVARDGREALDYLHSHTDDAAEPLYPALILLDIKMPGLNGIEVLEYLKKHPKLQTIPVVMLGGSPHESDVRQCRQHGCEDFIVKPNNFDQLSDALNTLHRFWTTAAVQ